MPQSHSTASLNSDIETIINKSEAVKKAKKDGKEKTKQEKKELSDEEKEYKSMRKQIQEKLIKFATRVPIFMYLTDYRERSLKDVITQLEPGLFKKVTGLDVKDFNLLCSIGVFNASLMNDAIFKFKRYEDNSLSYTGIDKHQGEDIGGWDTVIRREEYEKLFFNQQATMDAPEREEFIEELEDKPVVVSNSATQKIESKPVPNAIPELVTKAYGIIQPTDVTPVKPTTLITSQPKPEVSKVDLSKIVEGATVKHKIFGEGEIVKVDKAVTHVTVKFKMGEKSFVIGGQHCAFANGFLKL